MPAAMEFVSFDKKYAGIAKVPGCNKRHQYGGFRGRSWSGQIEEVFETKGGRITWSLYELFDTDEGNQILKGHKSVAYSLTFRAKDKNLEEARYHGCHEPHFKGTGSHGYSVEKVIKEKENGCKRLLS